MVAELGALQLYGMATVIAELAENHDPWIASSDWPIRRRLEAEVTDRAMREIRYR